MRKSNNTRRGFSLIELVIVVVIIAIIAAIAIPKMSRGAAGANDSALMQDLAQMRSAIELFTAEHGGAAPSATATTFVTQMTGYSDGTGAAVTAKDSTHIYGPYLKAIPPMPVGTNKGSNAVTNTGSVGTGTAGWFWDGTNIWCNNPAADADAKGTQYNQY